MLMTATQRRILSAAGRRANNIANVQGEGMQEEEKLCLSERLSC
jgi:hypothetical protein